MKIMNVQIGDAVTALSVADTPDAWETGLQWITYIPPGNGMIFIFPEEMYVPIWMKGVHISLDILWIWSELDILHIEKDVPPETDGVFEEYSPNLQARYVIELPGGFCKKNGINVATSIAFSRDSGWGNSV